jgi:hypothetical protein
MKMEAFGSSEAGKKGGRARAEKLTKEQRANIGRQGAIARWGEKPILQATHAGMVKFGDSEINCYVLEDGSRILSTRGVMMALGRTWRGRKYSGTELPVFLEAKNLSSFISQELKEVLTVVEFQIPNGKQAEGFSADLLRLVCETYLEAREAGVLTKQQLPIAKQAEILIRGFAKIGIIALVDEATGYQRDRAVNELAKILEAFVAKEIQKWLPTFDLEFYELMCYLRGEPMERVKARPPYFGKLTNNLVYQRLAPGVLEKLREVNPVTANGRRKNKHHQYLTPDLGHPKLKEHLAGVTAVMKIAKMQNLSWIEFLKMIDKTHPKWQSMPLFDRLANEDSI